jgi:hypothetical protein
VVVILTGEVPAERGAVGRALAADLGWRFEEAAKRDFQVLTATAAARREPLVIAGPLIDPAERDAIRGELRQVRFIQLRRGMLEHQPYPDLAIDSTQPIGATIAVIRKEFGI